MAKARGQEVVFETDVARFQALRADGARLGGGSMRLESKRRVRSLVEASVWAWLAFWGAGVPAGAAVYKLVYERASRIDVRSPAPEVDHPGVELALLWRGRPEILETTAVDYQAPASGIRSR